MAGPARDVRLGQPGRAGDPSSVRAAARPAADCTPEEYLARRTELGASEVNRRLLGAARLHTLLLDTGYRGDDILDVPGMARVSGAATREIVRLEAVAEQVASGLRSGTGFPDAYRAALAAATRDAVGLKSIVAHRDGLDFDPSGRPATRWRSGPPPGWTRSPAPASSGSPIRCCSDSASGAGSTWRCRQFHVGYGDADVDLARCNPLLMTDWLKATRESGAAVMLLHCYPYHREAGYLAQVYPHVYCDVGLAINYTGARAAAIIAESLELTPFHKALFSTDTFGLPELYYVGATLFRQGLTETLTDWVDRGHASVRDAVRIAELIGNANARRVYRLDRRDPGSSPG
ncbi:MAG: amidohydrolase [Micropruina sp.]